MRIVPDFLPLHMSIQSAFVTRICYQVIRFLESGDFQASKNLLVQLTSLYS